MNANMLYNFKGLLLCVCVCAHKIVSNITIGEVLRKSFHYNLYHIHNTHTTHTDFQEYCIS